MEIIGVLEFINEVLEGINVVVFIFDAKTVSEKIKADGKEIENVKLFTYEEILNMKEDLRTDGYFLSTTRNKMNNKIQPLYIIKITN